MKKVFVLLLSFYMGFFPVLSSVAVVDAATCTPTLKAPTMLSPKPSSTPTVRSSLTTLPSTSVTFMWSNECANTYDIAVGTTGVASANIFWKQDMVGGTASLTVSNLPKDASTVTDINKRTVVYVRVFSRFSNLYIGGDSSFLAYQDPVTTVSSGPMITAQTPSNGSTGVAVNVAPKLTFSKAMDKTTVNANTVQLRKFSDDTAVGITYAWNTAKTIVTLKHTANLSYSTSYYLWVSGAKDTLGNLETTDYTTVTKAMHAFTTVAPPDKTAPTILSQTPTNGSKGVVVTVAPTLTFSEPMNPSTINSNTVKLRKSIGDGAVGVAYSWNSAKTMVTLTPSASLANNTSYYLWVSGAKDVAGNVQATLYGINQKATHAFTTVALVVAPEPVPVVPVPIVLTPITPVPVISTGSTLTAVWANDGGDKITRDEIRATKNATSVVNSVWDGSKVSLFGAKNEVIAFNTILEASSAGAKNVSVSFNTLTGPNGATIASVPTTGNGVFDWTQRNIELFYVRYLQIKGLSKLSYETYDERHIPKRFERPFTGAGFGTGTWADRPDHDKFYPDIAVPLELKPTFDIAAGQNQSIWADVYIPKTSPSGLYQGTFTVQENGVVTKQIPVQLTVRNFELSDVPASKTMVNFSRSNVNKHFTGNAWPNAGTAEDTLTKKVRDRLFQIAHRHKISLIEGDETNGDQPSAEWIPRLTGSLFTALNGYAGPGVNTGNNVYSIGTYGSWGWQSQGEMGMRTHSDGWVNWFNANSPMTEYFLYLIDESSNYPQIQQWASWIKNNLGPGKSLKSFATIPLPDAVANTPLLDIPASWFTVGATTLWENAMTNLRADVGKKAFFYNGKRPSNGSFATEDDGVALRELSWAQYKKGISRWFFWESTYYNDYQGGRGETNVFQNAQTFGSAGGTDSVVGETGWNHSNGDGVLFYPGTDKVFPQDSYGVDGAFASIRLKEWRRGIQDVDYLTMAAAINPTRVQQIVSTLVPKALWEYGIADVNDPTWVRSDISWSTDPNVWEAARAELANIIEGK